MSDQRLRIAARRYPWTERLIAGSLRPSGLELEWTSHTFEQATEMVTWPRELDVAEVSLATYAMALDQGISRVVGLPVFPFRAFRHSMLWVEAESGLERPDDLVGGRIGIDRLATTALVYLRGLLRHEYGLADDDVTWVRLKDERMGFRAPEHVPVRDVRGEETLVELLVHGRIDAMAAFWDPQHARDRRLRRLFRGHVRDLEASYYQRTGIYPIMHILVMDRDQYLAQPELAARLTDAFQQAKQPHLDEAHQGVVAGRALSPWTPLDLEFSWSVLGTDPVPYGVAANSTTLNHFLDLLMEQQLVQSRIRPEDLLAPHAVSATDA